LKWLSMVGIAYLIHLLLVQFRQDLTPEQDNVLKMFVFGAFFAVFIVVIFFHPIRKLINSYRGIED
ncbi:MAG: hypothetical protein O7G88_09140, partial [bacterium]|nr:hypothetical protein [bacterium]